MPVIALILVAAFYMFFNQKIINKPTFKKFILFVTILAFLLNFTLEVIQGSLYEGYVHDLQHISFCALGLPEFLPTHNQGLKKEFEINLETTPCPVPSLYRN